MDLTRNTINENKSQMDFTQLHPSQPEPCSTMNGNICAGFGLFGSPLQGTEQCQKSSGLGVLLSINPMW